jgi:hypothetical protein
MKQFSTLQKIRGIILFYMVALVVAGATAFPVETELNILCSLLGINEETVNNFPSVFGFVYSIKGSITEMNQSAPQLAYGYDWLAFAHLVIALMFIGPLRDPIRNKWVIQWGMIACVAILPLAFICGPIREIPILWTLIDCSFGVFGIIPLIFCMKLINRLEKEQQRTE